MSLASFITLVNSHILEKRFIKMNDSFLTNKVILKYSSTKNRLVFQSLWVTSYEGVYFLAIISTY